MVTNVLSTSLLDPRHWTPFHVAHWIRWAIGEFRLHSVDANEWIHITGQDIVDMSHEMFAALVPDDNVSSRIHIS